MSYPMDLDEYAASSLLEELRRREQLRSEGSAVIAKDRCSLYRHVNSR